MDHVAQAAVVSYILVEEAQGATVAELIDEFTPNGNDGSIERAVTALERAELLTVNQGQVWARGK